MSAYSQLNTLNTPASTANLYASAFTQIASVFNKHDTSQAYNAGYSSRINKMNAMMSAAHGAKNLANIRSRKTFLTSQIESTRLETEAYAKLNAAVAGTKGNSVDAVTADIRTNATNAIQGVARESSNQSKQEAASIFAAYSQGISTRPPTIPRVDYAKIVAAGAASSGTYFMNAAIDGTLPWQLKEK